jgi:hypothetical protein
VLLGTLPSHAAGFLQGFKVTDGEPHSQFRREDAEVAHTLPLLS